MSPIAIPFSHNYINRRGRGLGGILKSIGSVIKPFFSQTKSILKPIGREIGREGLSLLSNTAKEALNGVSLADALKNNLVKKKKKIVRKVKRKIVGKGGKNKGKGKGKGKAKGKGKSKGKGKVKGRGKAKGKGKGAGRKRKVSKKKKKKSIFDGYSLS